MLFFSACRAEAQWVVDTTVTYTGAAATVSGAPNAGGTGLTDEVGSSITGGAVISGGSNYTSVPNVVVPAPSSGVTASGALTISTANKVNGYVPAINGSGYNYASPPSFIISGGGGTGASVKGVVGNWYITSGHLKSSGNYSQPYYSWLDKSTTSMNQRVVASFDMIATSTSNNIVLRGHPSTFTGYVVGVSQTQLQAFYETQGTRTQLGSTVTLASPLTVGDTITMDVAATSNTGGTTLTVTITDATTSTIIYTGNIATSDTSPGVQIADGPGNYGVASSQQHSYVRSLTFYYQYQVGVSPTSALLNSSPTITLTATGGETWTPGTPGSPVFSVFNINGTTSSIVAQTVVSSTQASVTINTGDVSGAIQITESGSSYYGYLVLIVGTQGPPSLVSSTSTTVTLSAPAAINMVGSVTYYFYRVANTYVTPPTGCTLVGTQSSVANGTAPSNFRDTPPRTYPASTYYYSVVAIDSQGQVATSTAYLIMWIGKFKNFKGRRINDDSPFAFNGDIRRNVFY